MRTVVSLNFIHCFSGIEFFFGDWCVLGRSVDKELIGKRRFTKFVGNPRIGDGFEFDVIIAIILGGTRLTGGRGTILGTLIGALIVAVIGSGLNMLGMLSFWQKVLKGVILVLAILLNEKLRK